MITAAAVWVEICSRGCLLKQSSWEWKYYWEQLLNKLLNFLFQVSNHMVQLGAEFIYIYVFIFNVAFSSVFRRSVYTRTDLFLKLLFQAKMFRNGV